MVLDNPAPPNHSPFYETKAFVSFVLTLGLAMACRVFEIPSLPTRFVRESGPSRGLGHGAGYYPNRFINVLSVFLENSRNPPVSYPCQPPGGLVLGVCGKAYDGPVRVAESDPRPGALFEMLPWIRSLGRRVS